MTSERHSRLGDEGTSKARRKSGDRIGEIAPVKQHGNACYFPMARWRVLAMGDFLGIAPLAPERNGGQGVCSANGFCRKAQPKPPSAYKVIGKSIPQKAIPGKVMGTAQYVTDVKVEGMPPIHLTPSFDVSS